MKGALFKDQVLSDRERKNLDILEVVRRYGPVTRTEISRITKYNIVTVSNYVNNYIKKDLVIEKGLDISSGGRKPTLVELNSRNCFVIGIDIGPTHIIAALTDLSLNMITKVKKSRSPLESMEEVVSKSIELIYEIIEKSQVEAKKIRGLGIGISGIIDAKAGTVRDTDPKRGRTAASYISIKNLIEREFGIPTFVGNDATVAAFGEKRIGLDAEIENVLYMFSDVGCGIIIKGEIYAGAGGSAGEVQLNVGEDVEDLPKDVGLFRPGSINLGIVDAARAAITQNKPTKLREMCDSNTQSVTADMVIDAARQGDKIAIEILEKAGLNLGVRIAYMINLFNPEIVILGGGMEQAGDLILEPIKRMVRRLAFEEPASMVRIIPSRLGENAVSLGSASLVIREIFIHA